MAFWDEACNWAFIYPHQQIACQDCVQTSAQNAYKKHIFGAIKAPDHVFLVPANTCFSASKLIAQVVTLGGWCFLVLGLVRMFAASAYQQATQSASSTTFMLLEACPLVMALGITFKS
jgi:hypothetical protein